MGTDWGVGWGNSGGTGVSSGFAAAQGRSESHRLQQRTMVNLFNVTPQSLLTVSPNKNVQLVFLLKCLP